MSDVFFGRQEPWWHADIVVGLGARSGVGAAEILALIDTQLAAAGLTRSAVAACVTLDRRSDHPGIAEAATHLGVPLHFLAPEQLAAQAPSPSDAVFQLAGVPSVAEAAALAFGDLVVGKARSAGATCALSRIDTGYAGAISSAPMASSTLQTSWASS